MNGIQYVLMDSYKRISREPGSSESAQVAADNAQMPEDAIACHQVLPAIDASNGGGLKFEVMQAKMAKPVPVVPASFSSPGALGFRIPSFAQALDSASPEIRQSMPCCRHVGFHKR